MGNPIAKRILFLNSSNWKLRETKRAELNSVPLDLCLSLSLSFPAVYDVVVVVMKKKVNVLIRSVMACLEFGEKEKAAKRRGVCPTRILFILSKPSFYLAYLRSLIYPSSSSSLASSPFHFLFP